MNEENEKLRARLEDREAEGDTEGEPIENQRTREMAKGSVCIILLTDT